jgi:vacuolar-type H+-ATPase subunit I/STV1
MITNQPTNLPTNPSLLLLLLLMLIKHNNNNKNLNSITNSIIASHASSILFYFLYGKELGPLFQQSMDFLHVKLLGYKLTVWQRRHVLVVDR